MFYLFSDLFDFKTYIGGGANVSLKMNSLAPTIRSTAEKHLQGWLGELLTEAMDNAAAPDAALTTLLPYLKRPLALLTMYEYSAIGAIQFTESGIQRIENDRYKTAYKYQENEYKKHMLETGYEAIEQLLRFLDENAADYPTWQNDPVFEKNKALFLNYAAEMRASYSSYISRYTFDLLRPLIEDIECFALVPLFGQPFFDELKTAIRQGNLSADQKKVVQLSQKAIASFAIEEGMSRHWVRLEGRNVVQTELLGDQSAEKSAAAGNQPLGYSVRKNDEWANRHINKLKTYLADNLDLFPTYKTYYDEQTEEEEEANDTPESCEVQRGSDKNSRKTPAIFRL